jgi:hypothetical protein
MRWIGHVACMREKRYVYRVLVGKREEMRPFERHRRRWVYNLNKVDLQEMGREAMNWIDLAEVNDKW